MKKIFRKKIFAFFLSALLVLALSLPVFADMGPKPSVTLKLYYTPGQRYAVTLLGNTRVSGPWGSADQYRERMGSRETWEAFKNYPAPEVLAAIPVPDPRKERNRRVMKCYEG